MREYSYRKGAPLLVVLAICWAGLAVAQAPPPNPAPAPAPPSASANETPPAQPEEGIPLVFDGETLWYVYEPVGAFSPRERAERTAKRLLLMAEDPFYSEDLFSVKMEGEKATVFYRDEMVGVVTEKDSVQAGRSSAEIAAENIYKVKEAVRRYRERRLPETRLKGRISAGVATLVLILLLYGGRRIYLRLRARVEAHRETGQDKMVVKALRLKAEETAKILLWVLKSSFFFLTLVLILAYLEATFSFLPETRGYSMVVLNYLMEPLRVLWRGFLGRVGDLFFILVVVVLTRYLLKAVRWLMIKLSEEAFTLPGISPEWALPLYKILRMVVLAVAAVVIYPYIPGSDTAAFKGISLFAGALFTLGASGAANNLIGGISLIVTGAFRVGDRVKVGDVTGDVVELTLLVTRLRTIKNEVVTIPNAKVMSAEIVDYSSRAREEGLILHTSVTIGYDAPWRKVHELLIQAARRTGGILEEPAPFVLQTALNDFYVTYEINAYTRGANEQVQIYAELHQNIQDCFNEAGVEIMSAHYSYLRDGNAVTIPAPYRSEGYAPPRFGVRVEEREEGKG